MASIKERNGRYSVIYKYTDDNGKVHQKWETFATKKEARNRQREIEYHQVLGDFQIPQCKLLRELLEEYVNLYGKEKWSLSTYDGNVRLIENYINPIIGDTDITEINTRFMERYYQKLLRTPSVKGPNNRKKVSEYVTSATIRDIHKLLRSCFTQAEKWELISKNPTVHANLPKHTSQKRDIWDAETLLHALDVCENETLKMAINLAFCGSCVSENCSP